MTNDLPNNSARLYQLAVAKDTANLIDADAALALARGAVRTLMQLSPASAALVQAFAEEEIQRLEFECSEEAVGSIAIIRDALKVA
jgi:hypothetical protein